MAEENTNGSAGVATPAPAPEPEIDRGHQEANEFVDNFFGIGGKSFSTPVQTKPEGQESSTSEPAPTPPAIDYDAEIARLQGEVGKKEKMYNDLQSDIDRRVNVATRGLNEKLSTIEGYLAALAGRSTPGNNPNDQTGQFGEDQFGNALPNQKPALEALIRAEVSKTLESHEGVKAGKMVKDLNAFREKYPDSYQFDPIIKQVYSSFPHLASLGIEGMEQAYNYARSMVLAGLEQAKSAEEAKKTAQVNPQAAKQPPAVTPQTGISPQQAQELAVRAAKTNDIQGVSVSGETRPSHNWHDMNEEQAARAFTEMLMNRRR